MKKNLILPIAGESTRYPKGVPKWFIKHPIGSCMLVESISGLPIKEFDDIYIIGLKEHSKYISEAIIEIKERYDIFPTVILLASQTSSQPETVYTGIKQGNITGSILIKDCDGQFTYSPDWSNNHVAVGNLHKIGKINAGNKSYVKIDKNNTLGNIVEKQVISNLFSVGGYYFVSAEEFCSYYEQLQEKNIYVSHVIYKMLLDKKIFFIEEVENYKDWGTIDDWMDYIRQIYSDKTIVMDIDGAICRLQEKAYSNREPNKDVVDKLRQAKKHGYYVIISSSRNVNTYRANEGIIAKNTLPIILEFLQKNNIPFDEIRINFPWCGHNGFYVNDRSIRVDEFVNMSFDEIDFVLEKQKRYVK